MSKTRSVRIQLNFLCTDRNESGVAIGRIASFIAGEEAGSTYSYLERKAHEDEVSLSVEMLIVVNNKSEDDAIETKLDNNLASFPGLYPGTEPRFHYMSDGVEEIEE